MSLARPAIGLRLSSSPGGTVIVPAIQHQLSKPSGLVCMVLPKSSATIPVRDAWMARICPYSGCLVSTTPLPLQYGHNNQKSKLHDTTTQSISVYPLATMGDDLQSIDRSQASKHPTPKRCYHTKSKQLKHKDQPSLEQNQTIKHKSFLL